MQFALITDTHFGARSDNQSYDDYFRKFYTETFFPELERRNIKNIIHLGDIFDRRKYINFNTLKNCREYFFDELQRRNIQMFLLVGNHDTFFKNTNDVNSPRLLLDSYPNITVIDTPREETLRCGPILFMPWICTDNYAHCMDMIKNTKAKTMFGHLEITGFIMHRGQQCEGGFDPQTFEKFDRVFSGHFHHRSTKGNITYLGNPYELTWNDYDDPRGFHIWCSDSNELEFIENPNSMFYRIVYDDKNNPEPIKNLAHYQDRSVKLIVANKTNFSEFDALVDRLYQVNPLELKIIEDFSEFESEAIDEENLNLEDTMTLLGEYVDSIETDADKERLKTLLKTLYVEAQDYEGS
jgi:DNA repair exonuclease SbcCD nuclease subunit